MIEEAFASGNSFIHKIYPKIRILCAGLLSIAAALCDNFYFLPGYLVISIILVVMANLSPIAVAKRLKTVVWFLLMIWVIVPLTFEGEILYQWHAVKITRPGIELCGMISVKSITILFVFIAMIATMSMASLGSGLHQLYVPDKMVFLLLMSYRYIGVIEDEYNRLLRAAKFRGFKPGTNLHSYKTFAYLAGMLFVRASFRAQRVYQAMICRGFNGKFHTLDEHPINRLNSVFLISVFVIVIMFVLFEIYWL